MYLACSDLQGIQFIHFYQERSLGFEPLITYAVTITTTRIYFTFLLICASEFHIQFFVQFFFSFFIFK